MTLIGRFSFVPAIALAVAGLIFAGSAQAGPGGGVTAQVADLDADKNADLLIYRSSDRKVFAYFLDGKSVLSSKTIKNLPANYGPLGSGDVNGNKAGDLLSFRASDRKVFGYLLSDTTSGTVDNQKSIKNLPVNFDVSGIGDLNGDKIGDLVAYRASDRKVFAYFLNSSGSVASQKAIKTLPNGYVVGGFANIDGDSDNTDDLVMYRASDRKVFVYFLDSNAAIIGSKTIKTLPNGYELSGLADVNDDGTADVLAVNTAQRKVFAYFLDKDNAGGVTGQKTIKVYPSGFEVAGYGDLDNNGASDIIVYRDTDRKVFAYLLTQNTASVDTQGTIKLLPANFEPLPFGVDS